ncbi:MAG: 3-oxoadipate enol-lactonase [Anaerolineales bacterium]
MDFCRAGELTTCFSWGGAGNGSPLVFIHSLGTDLRIWDAVVAELKDEHACLRYDLRGHGLSDCPHGPYALSDFTNDLNALLNAVELDQVLLVGISIGGLIALGYGLAHAAQVKGLILADTGARIGTAEGWQERIEKVQKHGLEAVAPEILPRWFAQDFANTQPVEYAGYLNMLARQPARGYVSSCAALKETDLRDGLGELAAPALVLCGEHDNAITPESCRQLAESLPYGIFAAIPNSGHLPCLEQPGEFARQVRAFVETLP